MSCDNSGRPDWPWAPACTPQWDQTHTVIVMCTCDNNKQKDNNARARARAHTHTHTHTHTHIHTHTHTHTHTHARTHAPVPPRLRISHASVTIARSQALNQWFAVRYPSPRCAAAQQQWLQADLEPLRAISPLSLFHEY